ncbi:MAG: T9SS type A sorting domain-containing protein [Sphaerochaetaceae bacterium]|nr:T9SS type A sorting domain-containing protein [Sphaerochaetaceae bacterium]
MKKIMFIFALLFSAIMVAQTPIDLSGMTEDITLGSNCSSSQTPEHYVTTGDLNLNGFTLHLKNVLLEVSGNVNGGGEISYCGSSELCASGNVQNNPTIENGLSCNTLSTDEVGLTPVYSFSNLTKTITIHNSTFIKVFDMTGKMVLSTDEDTLNFSKLTAGIYIFKADNFTRKLPVY